jgi:hypothetical protein
MLTPMQTVSTLVSVDSIAIQHSNRLLTLVVYIFIYCTAHAPEGNRKVEITLINSHTTGIIHAVIQIATQDLPTPNAYATYSYIKS